MTQTVTLPNGDEIDFPDNMSQDELSAAVSRHMAATNSGATPPDSAGNEPSIAARKGGFPTTAPPATNMFGLGAHTDDTGQPEFLTPALTPEQDANVGAAAKLASRTLLRANPVLALPNAAFVGGEHLINAASEKLGGPTKEVFNPLESGIHGLGLDMAPDASPAMQTADAILPWLVPSGNQVGRVAEAAGPFNKAMTFARSEAMNAASWAASEEAQKFAREHGYGPLAQTIAGFVGGAAPNTVAHYAGPPVARTIIPPKPDAGEKFDVNKALLPSKEGGASTVPPMRDVADQGGSVASILSGAGSLPFSGSGQSGAIKAQTEAIARTADAGLQKLDPGTTPVLKAGPGSVNTEASNLGRQAQEKIMSGEQDLRTRANNIEGALSGARVDAGPLRGVITGLLDPTKVGDSVATEAQRIANKLDRSIGPDGKVDFDVLKTERSALKERLDGLVSAPTGEAQVANSVARKLRPIEDAMTERMSTAADSVDPNLGDAWRQLDSEWSQHGAMKRDLAKVGGVLTPDRQGFDPDPGASDISTVLTKAVAGRGGVSPIFDIERGLGEQQARSAVAETVAALGRPKNARGTQDFRPDIFGEGEQGRVDSKVMDWVEQKAGPEARANIENAAVAGSGTASPPKPGGWSKAFGSVLAAVPFAPTLGHLTTPLSPLVASLLSAGHDPDLIRAVANRTIPMRELAPQVTMHGALGSQPSNIDPAQMVKSWATNTAGTVPSVLRYLATQGGR